MRTRRKTYIVIISPPNPIVFPCTEMKLDSIAAATSCYSGIFRSTKLMISQKRVVD
jgi:hypothetical protein